jgi:hypothetical protein
MATITTVQAAGATSATLNPTLTLASTAGAGDYFLLLVGQTSPTMPGTPTDTFGNTYRMLSCQDAFNSPTGLSLCLFDCFNTTAGKPTITFPTTASSQYGVIDLSGVNHPARGCPEGFSMGTATATSDFSTLAHTSTIGDVVVALALVDANIPLALQSAGWTTLKSLQATNISLQLVMQTVPGAGLYTARWTTTQPVNPVVACVSLPHA